MFPPGRAAELADRDGATRTRCNRPGGGPDVPAPRRDSPGRLVSAHAWPDRSRWMREFLTVPRAKAPVS
ncbi:hypothetical protein ACWEKM_30965 [Streptomyces sp. NPDC004752]